MVNFGSERGWLARYFIVGYFGVGQWRSDRCCPDLCVAYILVLPIEGPARHPPSLTWGCGIGLRTCVLY